MPLLAFLLQGWPEAILMIWAGLLLVGVKPKFKYLLIAGLIDSAIVAWIRTFNMPFGMHIPLAILVGTIVVYFLLKIEFKAALAGVLIGFIFLIVFESIFIPIMLKMFNLTFEQVLANTAIRILIGLPQEIMLALIIFLCLRFNFNLIDTTKGILNR